MISWKKKRSVSGYTLTEVVLAAALLSIIVLAVAPLFSMVQGGFTSSEAQNGLKSGSEIALNQISHRLVECKRIFERTAADNLFLARLQLTSPAALTGSQLALKEEQGALSRSTSSFVATSVGNRLFFASVGLPRDVDVLDSGGLVKAERIDVYTFNYYYLAQDTSVSIAGKTKLNLWEWHGKPIADYNQITNLTDATKLANVVTMLVSSGVTVAWNPTQTNVLLAFYDLNSDGSIVLDPDYTLPPEENKPMVKLLTGQTMGGYKYGICPNTIASMNADITVPVLGNASGNFPGGFEVVIVGPNSSRQVLIRMVSIARGRF